MIFEKLANIDRRIIYLFVLVSLSAPMIMGVTLTPVPLPTSKAFFDSIEKLDNSSGKIVIISSDWGPNTKAENKPQTEAAIEHLMRKRIPFAITTLYALAEPFLRSMPRDIAEKLEKEAPGEKWEYGKDWVNIGYKPGGSLMIQGLAKSADIRSFWKTDASGTPLESIPMLKSVRSLKDVQLLIETTGLVGAFGQWIGFFLVEDYRPDMLHGCTSITIPEARTYFSSGQITGLLEGVAGAAAYEKLLSDQNPNRLPGEGWITNTGLAFAQICIIGFIIIGNLGFFLSRKRRGESS